MRVKKVTFVLAAASPVLAALISSLTTPHSPSGGTSAETLDISRICVRHRSVAQTQNRFRNYLDGNYRILALF